MNIRNRFRTTLRRWELHWQETPTEVCVAIAAAFALMAVIAMMAGCSSQPMPDCQVQLTTNELRLEGERYRIVRETQPTCYEVSNTSPRGAVLVTHVLCTYEEVEIEERCK